MLKTSLKAVAGIFVVALLVQVGGCASAEVTSTKRASGGLPKPDVIVVHNFAVNANEVTLDRGVVATALRDSEGKMPTEEEDKVGHMVAEKLTASLIEELGKSGIHAVRAGTTIKRTPKTADIQGQFVNIDQGNQTARVWIGFGMGGSQLRTDVQILQNGKLVAEGETSTKSGLKPGMLTSMGAGSAVAGAASAGVNEAFVATVEADAKRTAKEVAKKIRAAYVERGWLVN